MTNIAAPTPLSWLVLLAVAGLLGCSGEPSPFSERHHQALRAAGLDGVAKPAYWQPFVCSESDSLIASTGFEANGVRGNICCGLLKGCTIRTE